MKRTKVLTESKLRKASVREMKILGKMWKLRREEEKEGKKVYGEGVYRRRS